VSYILSSALYFITLNGIGFQFFWPSFPNIDTYFVLTSIASVVIFSSLFVVEFLNLRKVSFYLVWYFYALALLALIFSFPLLNDKFELVATLYATLALIAFISFIAVGIYCWKKEITEKKQRKCLDAI
jgi:hypothetical protein